MIPSCHNNVFHLGMGLAPPYYAIVIHILLYTVLGHNNPENIAPPFNIIKLLPAAFL
jgi:hypothetical protein